MNNEQIPLQREIKAIAARRGMTLDKIREEYNEKFGTNYIQQSFSRKLSNGAFRYDELQNIGEILGFKVKLELVDKKEGD